MEQMFDVVAVGFADNKVLWVMGPRNAVNAEAIIRMAVARQGVEDRFFTIARPGTYATGDKYLGDWP